MLKQRILTALVLAPVMIGGIFYLPITQFMLFIAAIVVIGAWEWANLAGLKTALPRIGYAVFIAALIGALTYFDGVQEPDVLYLAFAWWMAAFVLVATHPKFSTAWSHTVTRLVMGVFVLVPMWVGFVQIKSYPFNDYLILFVMFVIWGADVGAYFAGRRFGKRKLAPNVSPGKTWEGVYGGLVATTVIACLGAWFLQDNTSIKLNFNQWLLIIATTYVLTFVSVVGDLLESLLKRHRGIKDSSNLLPGHGGVMDRIDSMTAAIPVFALALSAFAGNLLV